jgi:hypothetical protein
MYKSLVGVMINVYLKRDYFAHIDEYIRVVCGDGGRYESNQT